MAKTWSQCRFRALICSNAGYIHIKVDQWLLCRSCRGKYLSCSTTHATDCTYKSRGIIVGVQTMAAIANDESLQLRVRKAHLPEGRSSWHPLAHRGAKTGCLLTSRSAASLRKLFCCVRGPCETGETLNLSEHGVCTSLYKIGNVG